MGFFNNIIDSFNSAEFSVSGNKKLKSLSRHFKKDFGLSLVFFKGNIIADGDQTLASLNKKTSLKVNTTSEVDLKIKGNMKVNEVEKLFKDTFWTKVQIKDKSSKNLIENDKTLGDAARENS